MILLGSIAALASLALVIQVWQAIAAFRFPLHRRVTPLAPAPAVSVLKPLKGADPQLRDCLASWLALQHPGPLQILFGVHSPDDPAILIVRELLTQYPGVDAQCLVCPDQPGPNAKVCTLAQLLPHARHDLILVSDADVKVPTDFIGQVTSHFADPDVGLVNCFYRMANLATAALRWEAVAVNADFWSQVLQSRTLKPQDFALGAVMVVRRPDLLAVGGFNALVHHLADDFHLGRRIHALGRRIELSTTTVDCWDPTAGWAKVWSHQLRWTRTIRVCQPGPFFASILSNGSIASTGWLVLALVRGSSPTIPILFLLGRALIAAILYRRIRHGLPGWLPPWRVWIKDVLGAVLWAAAFLGNTVEWRGTRFKVHADGTLRILGTSKESRSLKN
jgi:ceramide glucosyltransferase